MADKILHKRSGTPSAVPSAGSLELGELALNTADGRAFMKKSDGAVVEIGKSADGFFRAEAIIATVSGQTSFTVPGGYTPGAIFVSLNGAALAPADFAATNGTMVVLASGTGIVAGSVLLVYVLTAFQVADALPLGGTAADSSRLGGSLAADFYQRSNILGIVSQAAGVPTGSIIERGSNANGEYVRWADGTQRCRFLHGGTGRVTWTFPAPFIAAPIVEATPVIDATGSAHGAHVLTVGLNSAEHYGWLQNGATTSVGTNTQRFLTAEGRWFD